MASFTYLSDEREEQELHRSRLLNVEQKPFQRITKRLLTPGSLVNTPSKLPTPPPDADAASQEEEQKKLLEERRQFKDDVILDFAQFDSQIARLQFLRNANERERERYKADKQRILDTAQDVRDSTVQLRLQLDGAKKTLEQRKKFDVLAEKITSNRLLRPREDQEINLRKLVEECRELERESQQYGETWKERREQFGRIVEEGMQLRRLIRDEKEEVERREGMDRGDEDGDDDGEVKDRGGNTPMQFSGNATPRADGTLDAGLKPRPLAGSRPTSRAPSPALSERRRQEEDASTMEVETKVGDDDVQPDTPMVESQIGPETPRVTIDEPIEDRAESVEEGEAEDKMDTT